MKNVILCSCLGLFLFLNHKSQAQATYAGNYALIAAYTSHYYSYYPFSRMLGAGTLTLRSNGNAAYTLYFGFNGYDAFYTRISPRSASGAGRVNSRGSFSFTSGASGSGFLLVSGRNGLGAGSFRDAFGQGVWNIVRQ